MLVSCVDLDLNPLSEASSENWYKSDTQLMMSVDNLYNSGLWNTDLNDWSDDWQYREFLTPVTNGTVASDWADAKAYYTNSYKAIARANTILENLPKAISNGVSKYATDQAEAECKFVRAAVYAYLIPRFGDLVDMRGSVSLDDAAKLKRTSKAELIPKVYSDFDFAIEKLPASYPASKARLATKGAAYALKARFALYIGDYAMAAEAAKACIDLNAYKLAPDFRSYFLPSTKNDAESIFLIPQSIIYNIVFSDCQNYIPRVTGGYAAKVPSWDLFASFLCTDGLPIDESPLFDPKNPFKNRDPRCTQTIVEFGTEWLNGFIFDPSPLAKTVINKSLGKEFRNKDSRIVDAYASYNGLIWKKGIDNSWTQNSYKVDPDKVIIRFADVLLIYAEAMIEQDKIDRSVLDAMNRVRARAYGTDYAATSSYPAITATTQSELRRILRVERRMEFAREGLRYMDIIRWKLAEKVLNRPNYGNLYPMTKINMDSWFWPYAPEIDDDGTADFSRMHSEGYIQLYTRRFFDKNRQYLFPIPSTEILINTNLEQNPGY